MSGRLEVWEINGSVVRVRIRRGTPAVWVLSEQELLVSLPPKLTRAQAAETLGTLRRQLEEGLL